MKALTLTQPYATLVAIRAKRIETRSWATKYRGPLAIHAAAGLGPVGGWKGLYALTRTQPFKAVLEAGAAAGLVPAYDEDLPRGAIVAVCELVEVVRIGDEEMVYPRRRNDAWIDWHVPPVGAAEYAFGDYAPGRHAWLLADIRALPEPVPAHGAQRLWEWDGELPS
jgi:hypothetical protein